MLTKVGGFLIILFLVAVVAAAVYEHDHHPKPPHPTVPTKYGMKGYPGKMISPKSKEDWLYAATEDATMCDAQIQHYLNTGIPVGGANFGTAPGAPACHIFKPMTSDEYTLTNDHYMTAYVGQAHAITPNTHDLPHGMDLEYLGY